MLDTLPYPQQIRNSLGNPRIPYVESVYEKLMVTCGVPSIPLSAMLDVDSSFYRDRVFPIALPGITMSAAAAVALLVRCWSIDDAYIHDAFTSVPTTAFTNLLKGVQKKLCPTTQLDGISAMAWTMFKRRRSNIIYVQDTITGIGRHIICVLNQNTPIQYLAPLWLWMDITHNPNNSPQHHSIFPMSLDNKLAYENIKTSHLQGHIQRACAACGALDTTTQRHKMCPCKNEAYCTTACQRKRWRIHKITNHC